MPYTLDDYQAYQAVDYGVLAAAFAGYGVVSGLEVSVGSGTVGEADTLAVSEGIAAVAGSFQEHDAEPVSIPENTSDNPRRDVLSINASNELIVNDGTPEEKHPRESYVRLETAKRPAPPTFEEIDGTPLCEIWVDPGVSEIANGDILRRFTDINPTFGDVSTQSLSIENPPEEPTDGVRQQELGGHDSQGHEGGQVGSEGDPATGYFSSARATSPPSETDEYATIGWIQGNVDTGGGSGGGSGGDGTGASYHVDDYGADPTGIEDSSAAIEDLANNVCDEHDEIVFGSGTYYLADQLRITQAISIDARRARIESDYHDGLAYPNDQNHYRPLFYFRGELGSTAGISSSAPRGTDSLYIDDPGLFDIGDGIVVRNIDTAGSVMDRSYTPTVATVSEVNDSTGEIKLTKALRYDVQDNWYATHIENQIQFPEIQGLKVYPRNEPTFDESVGKVLGGPRHIIGTRLTRGARIQDVYARGFDSHVWTTSDDMNAVGADLRAERPMNLSGSCGEPFYFNGSTDIALVRPRALGVRRGPDIRSGCDTLMVIHPQISRVSMNGLSFHGAEVAGRMVVVGGSVHCRGPDDTMDDHGGTEDRRWELQRGRIISSGVNSTIKAIGTEFIANYSATVRGRVEFDECDIRVHADAQTGIGPLILEEGNFEFDGTDFEIDATGLDAIVAGESDTTGGTVKLLNVDSDADIDLTGLPYTDLWTGPVDAPSVTAHTDTTVHDPYSVVTTN
ncbi:hypothetical protein [Halalkalicoccus jeotgali]|uniref:Pectate lyase superfamily protein domain-containing protein n=1 Tax=Halalkalicoccus jeotgali (strain DSM 18796 / CECT 7217 / JCM 14584 / KCTC 4019 / B3) TaxID=795797 RepID=D8J9P5_HALJB|nr:hypothetical protein [Halalkalicoccus jeotgali]ADJ14457.1 hypothetical protein HacjB3_05330 [Halalkalicoccus jeotgali B3]ELY40171.1 hypothetical protein C497_03705 [Halalkalicoccus jeotgali B3]